jgi:hypothetical protein
MTGLPIPAVFFQFYGSVEEIPDVHCRNSLHMRQRNLTILFEINELCEWEHFLLLWSARFFSTTFR